MPQKHLGYETPAAVAGRNVQDEFNLRNLDRLHGRGRRRRAGAAVRRSADPPHLMLMIWPPIAVSVLLRIVTSADDAWPLAEIRELVGDVTIASFLGLVLRGGSRRTDRRRCPRRPVAAADRCPARTSRHYRAGRCLPAVP